MNPSPFTERKYLEQRKWTLHGLSVFGVLILQHNCIIYVIVSGKHGPIAMGALLITSVGLLRAG